MVGREPGDVLQAGNWQQCCPHHFPQERSPALLSEPTSPRVCWFCTIVEHSRHPCLPCNSYFVIRGGHTQLDPEDPFPWPFWGEMVLQMAKMASEEEMYARPF